MHVASRLLCFILLAGGIFTSGCSRSTNSSKPAESHDAAASSEPAANDGEPAVTSETWDDYPDVPKVPIMTEVNGIPIPRVQTTAASLDLTAKIPADVGNDYAKDHPGRPAKGDWLIVRFNAEPESLNPVTESSAYQHIIGQYVHEPLARQDMETFEYKPHIARRWVIEDTVKLSPDYPGHERRIALDGGKRERELQIEYRKSEANPNASGSADNQEPRETVLTLRTTDPEGQPVGHVWVGFFPVGRIPGAPVNGYHEHSDARGKLEVKGLETGSYRVRVGEELYGDVTKNADGSLSVKPTSAENPLHEELKSSGQKSLTLAKDQWIDLQEDTVFTFYLRDDVKWSDGEPFTTKDLEFAYATINNPTVDDDHLRVYYADIFELKAFGPHVVRMKSRQQYFKGFEVTAEIATVTPPFHWFEAALRKQGKELTFDRLTEDEEARSNRVSVHGKQFGRFLNTENTYNSTPLGTGPYIIDKWVRADRVELHRNDEYWNSERRGYLDKLIFKFIPNNVTALQAFRAGELDFYYRVPAEQHFQEFAGPPEWFKEKYVQADWYSPGFSYIGWNSLRPMFADRRVRIALSLLVDVQGFLEKKLNNAGLRVTGSQYYFGPGYDHDVKPLAHAPDVAVDLLADAGWVDTDNDGVLDNDGQRFEFDYLLPNGSQTYQDLAALIQKSLKQAGIVMNVQLYEWGSFHDKVKNRQFDAYSMAWASPIESDPYQIWHGSDAGADKRGSNYVSFNDPLSNQLIEQMRLTLDPSKRQRIQFSFHRLLDREQPYTFLYMPKEFGAYHKRFQGVKWYRMRPGFDFTEWHVPKDQQIH